LPHLTSKFDNQLESFADEDASLIFETDRLRQFPEYEGLQYCPTEDKRILLKQWLFFRYEAVLRGQCKEEKQ
jgi:hypothetical protein